MKKYKKTVVASIVSVVFGISCCWLSSLIFWLGGATFVTSMSRYLDGSRMVFLIVAVLMILASIYLFRKQNRKSKGKK